MRATIFLPRAQEELKFAAPLRRPGDYTCHDCKTCASGQYIASGRCTARSDTTECKACSTCRPAETHWFFADDPGQSRTGTCKPDGHTDFTCDDVDCPTRDEAAANCSTHNMILDASSKCDNANHYKCKECSGCIIKGGNMHGTDKCWGSVPIQGIVCIGKTAWNPTAESGCQCGADKTCTPDTLTEAVCDATPQTLDIGVCQSNFDGSIPYGNEPCHDMTLPNCKAQFAKACDGKWPVPDKFLPFCVVHTFWCPVLKFLGAVLLIVILLCLFVPQLERS